MLALPHQLAAGDAEPLAIGASLAAGAAESPVAGAIDPPAAGAELAAGPADCDGLLLAASVRDLDRTGSGSGV